MPILFVGKRRKGRKNWRKAPKLALNANIFCLFAKEKKGGKITKWRLNWPWRPILFVAKRRKGRKNCRMAPIWCQISLDFGIRFHGFQIFDQIWILVDNVLIQYKMPLDGAKHSTIRNSQIVPHEKFLWSKVGGKFFELFGHTFAMLFL